MAAPAPVPPQAAIGAPHRLRALLEAHRLINSDLTLDAVLTRIVRTACDLVDSLYGALGVVGPNGGLQEFIHHGIDDDTVAALGDLPAARALRSVLFGEPADSMTMSAGLYAVPIRGRDEVYGTLYLARPASGAFSAEDEGELLAALASTAATAIGNARLYEDAQRSRDWLHASGEVARALLADTANAHSYELLVDIAARAREVANADYGALILPTEDHRLEVTAPAGIGSSAYDGVVFDAEKSAIGRSIVAGHSLLLSEIAAATQPKYDNEFGYGPLMLVPLVDARGVRGAVVLLRLIGRPSFGTRELELVTMFADQVALALELNDARADAESLRVLEVRHRIAQDMHDNLIQRLFATGMGLQMLAEKLDPGEPADKLQRHIAELDDVIDQVRERVFGLRQMPGWAQGSRGPTHVTRAPDKSA